MSKNYIFYSNNQNEVNILPLKKPCINKYDNAVIVPINDSDYKYNGVFDKDGNYVHYTGKRKLGKAHNNIVPQYKKINTEYINLRVQYLGYFNFHFGHMIVDSSIRMWSIGKCQDIDKYVCIADENTLPDYYIDLLEAQGIKIENIMVLNNATRFREVLVPDCSYVMYEYTSDYFKVPFDKLIKYQMDKFQNSNLEYYEKIYFSRKKFVKNNKLYQYGEETIEKLFENNGFQILYPEELGIGKTIYYLQNCKVLATGVGTQAHNIIFAHDDIEVYIINRYKTDYLSHQIPIDMSKNASITVVDACSDLSEKNCSYVYLNKYMKKFIKNRLLNYRLNIKDYFKSIIYYIMFIEHFLRVKLSIKSKVLTILKNINIINA